MKPFPSLNSILLLSTMLLTPSFALAQQAEAPAEQSAAEGASNEIVVLGRNIPEPMRQTSEVAAFLSADDLSRQGDDNAAAALTRLTGLSVVSGRFVFVRGLGDRYSSALLNGSPLPSPEPLRRTVPLDLFPSNILDGAAVQKTFSPNYPGEFGGGVIDLRTLRQPNANFLNVKLGTGVNLETTGQDGLTYFGGEFDEFGYDDGTRDLPGPVAALVRTNQRVTALSDADREALGESFENASVSVIQKGPTSPDFEAEVTGGASIDIGTVNVGLVGVVGYDSAWRTQDAQRRFAVDERDTTGAVTGSTIVRDETARTTALDVVVNALGSASVGWGSNEITSTVFVVRSTTKEAQVTSGTQFESGTQRLLTESTGWFERELATFQLAGEHEFGGLEIDWRGSAARSTRDAPYERELIRVEQTSGTPIFTGFNPSAYRLRFSELQDDVVTGGVDARYTFALSDTRDATLLGGLFYSNTVRNYSLFGFAFDATGGGLPADVGIARPDFLFSPDNIAPNRLVVIDQTGPDDTYKGTLLVQAAYLGADVELFPLIRAALGVRFEDGAQDLRTFSRFGAGTEAPVSIQNSYVLPAATLTWNFAEDLQLRLGYSQTIARPQFRELARSSYLDPDTDREYLGNPGLVDSELQNYDARVEYYFGRNQFFTGGAFYKQIDKPIEEVLFPLSGFQLATSFINAPEATVYGAEFEYRVNFELPFAPGPLRDKDWLFTINYTYTKSELKASASDTVVNPINRAIISAAPFGLDGAQLQGTPENIINAQFGYEGDTSQLTLLLGWVDERILQRGLSDPTASGAPKFLDIIDEPGIQLDLTYRRDFTLGGRDATFGFSARNLLDTEHREYQAASRGGDVEVNTYDRGRSISVSLSSKF